MLSIITPVLNGSTFIESNILSIQKLSIPFEHIIVDGGSTDGTLEIIKKYPNIRLLHQAEKNGMYGAIHQGFLEAQGEMLTWVNADDKVIPEGYSKLYSTALEKNGDLVYSNGVHHYIEKHSYKRIYAQPFARYALKQGVFPFVQPSAIFSRRAYFKIGALNFEKFRIIGDRDLFQRMAYDSSLNFLYVPVFSSVFLRYENSLLYRNLDRLKQERQYCIKTRVTLPYRFFYHLFKQLSSLF